MAQRQLPPVPPPPGTVPVRTTGAAPSLPAAPAAPARPVPKPSIAGQGITYADLVEAVRFTYPGQFDDEDPSALADVILEMYPQFRGELDETTRGMELLPSGQGGPARALDHLEKDPAAPGKWRPKPRTVTVAPPTGRAPTGTEQIITGGIRTVGGIAAPMVGTAVGGLVAATPAAPAAVPIGLATGGMVGAGAEYLAQKYEQAAGISEEISPLNVVGQGALNLVPFSAGARKAATILSGLGKGVAPKAAAALGRAAGASGLGAKIAEGAIEGAMGSLTGSSLETITEQDRLPTAEEMLSAAGIGTVFGAGIGGGLGAGQKVLQRRRQAKAGLDLNYANQLLDLMDPEVRGVMLPPAERAAQALEVSKTLQAAAALDPVGGKAGMTRLQQILDDGTQADLQLRAASFLQAFSEQAPSLTDATRLGVAQQFLAKIKEDGLNADALDAAVRAIAGVDTAARMAQATAPTGTMRPERMLPAANTAPGLVVDPVTGRERVGEVLLDRAPEQPIFAPESGPADVILRGDLGPPPPTLDAPAPRPPEVVTGRLRAVPEPPPPVVDWRGAQMLPPLDEQIAAARVVEAGRLAEATQPDLGLDPPQLNYRFPEPAPPPAAPKFQVPEEGLASLRAVAEGKVEPETAAILQLIRRELAEFPFEQARGKTRTQQRQRAQERADGQTEFETNRATERVPGTPIARSIAAIAGEDLEGMSRTDLDSQIASLLQGTSKVPGRLAVAAMKYARLLASAWNGKDFDRGLVSAQALKVAGLGTKRLHLPRLPMSEALTLADPDNLLLKYAPDRLKEREAVKAATAAEEALLGGVGERPLRPAPPPEVEAFLGELDDARLNQLYDDLQAQGEAGASGRQWVAQALEDRGLRQPEQAGLVEEAGAPAEPPMPSQDLLELERAMTEGGEPASAAPTSGPLNLLGSETGAVGRVAQERKARAARQAAEQRRLSPETAPKDLQLDDVTLRQLEKTVAGAGDSEVAGLIVGTPDGRIHRLIVSRNIAEDPSTTFEIAPETIAAIQQRARAQGLEVLGSWHTQPSGSALPSRADIRGNLADFPLLIIGTKGGAIRDAKVWQGGKKTGRGSGLGAVEGSLGVVADRPSRPGAPPSLKSIRAAIRKIPTFRGAMGDGASLERYLSDHADELSTEPFFHKAQAALEAGDANRAWLELQIGQVAYGNVTRQVAAGLPTKRAADVKAQIASLEAGSAQSPVGQLWALYDGRTIWVEGVGRLVVTPELPPSLEGTGVRAGPGGILRPPAASVPLPERATRTRMALEVVNKVLEDVRAEDILDDPTKAAGTRLFRQVAEEMLLHPASFKAMKALGVTEEQAAAHFSETVSESARILAALSQWKQRNKEGIRRIEGITGADGGVVDLMVTGRGRRVGRLSELTEGETFAALVKTENSWEKAILLQTLTEAGPTKLRQLSRASRGAMLSQWSTAMRNVYSATGRWGGEALVSGVRGLALAASGDMKGAQRAWAKAGDLIRYAPVLRPDGWVLPGNAMRLEWENIFNQSGWLFRFAPKERLQVLELLRSQPERAAHFIGAVNFGEEVGSAVGSGSKLLDWAAAPKVQAALTLFNRAQEFTMRSAMMHVTFNDRVRGLGLDPALAAALPADRLRALVGDDNYTHLFDQAVGEAMDFTFAGGPVRKGFERGGTEGGYNTAVIDMIQKLPVIREGYPFANFNLSAAPRYLWDHSGVSWLFDPLYAKVMKRGRYFLGAKAKSFRETLIPEANQAILDAQLEMRQALTARAAVKDEITARRRLATRYQKLPASQLELPGIQDKVTANLQALDRLETAAMKAEDAWVVADEKLKGWEAQKAKMLEVTAAAAKANAPEDWQELLARNSLGLMVMMPAAMMLRADQREKGVDWYQVKVGDYTADLRPFAPFVQYLFFADVLQDFAEHTNWAGVAEDLENEVYGWDSLGRNAFQGRYDGQYQIDDLAKAVLGVIATGLMNPIDFPSAVYANYEGKHTAKSLGADIMQVALSTSQIAGTTLALVDFVAGVSDRGLPSTNDGIELIADVVGQYLARFTIPFAPLKAAASLIDPEEAKVRIASTGDNKSVEGLVTGLAQPFANLPFIGKAMIPETYNQLTGQALETQFPALRALTGVGLSQWNAAAAEIERSGLPGTSVYIRKTGDVYLDRLIGYHYARLFQQYVPQLAESEKYQRLDSAALRRDELSKLLTSLKKAAIGFTAMDAGADTIKAARKGSEAVRREKRQERLRQLMQEEQLTEAEPVEAPPEEPLEDDEP